MNFLKFSNDMLDICEINEKVADASCGAISMFIGTTRDNCDGKTVVKLEYEAYESMGIKALEKICDEIRNRWGNVENIAIYHRLGMVPVKEASIIIAISSPHREEAIKATEFCINSVKQSVPIWKKEIYEEGKPLWKENKESPHPPKRKIISFSHSQRVDVPYQHPHLIQSKATNADIDNRIEKFIERKRNDLNLLNVQQFCVKRPRLNDDDDNEEQMTCARVDAVVRKRKDCKSHLEVKRAYNSYEHRDQITSDYLTKFIPKNGIEERLENVECQLSLTTPVPKNIYKRLRLLESRLLLLESISPEYIQFWDKTAVTNKLVKRKVFSIENIDSLIEEAEKKAGLVF